MRSRGFTLIEVLIAFTILAIVMGVTFAAIGNGLSQERRASATTLRVLAARSILDGLGIETPLSAGEIGGSLETGETWRVTLDPVIAEEGDEVDATAPVLYHADLTLYDDGRPVMSFVALKRVAVR